MSRLMQNYENFIRGNMKRKENIFGRTFSASLSLLQVEKGEGEVENRKKSFFYSFESSSNLA